MHRFDPAHDSSGRPPDRRRVMLTALPAASRGTRAEVQRALIPCVDGGPLDGDVIPFQGNRPCVTARGVPLGPAGRTLAQLGLFPPGHEYRFEIVVGADGRFGRQYRYAGALQDFIALDSPEV